MSDQNDSASMNKHLAEQLAMQTESLEYRKLADKVAEELAKGNTKYLNDNLSPNFIAFNSRDFIDSKWLPLMKELFTPFDHMGESVGWIRPSTDSFGNSGYSFPVKVVYKNDTSRNIKIYVIKEDQRLVIANIEDLPGWPELG